MTTGLNASLISLSADGRELAYSVATNRSNIWSVALPNTGSVSSRAAELVTSDKETIESIGVSADGQWLIFDSDRAGVQQIFRRPLGGGTLQQITRGSAPTFSASISPDSRFIAFHTIANGVRRAFVASIEGGDQPVQVSRGVGPDERNPVWSPDGSRLAWQMLESGSANAASAVEVATRSPSEWGAIKRVEVPAIQMQAAWLGGGTLLGRDLLNRRLLAVNIDRASEPPRDIARGLVIENMPVGQGVISTDGRTLLIRNRLGIWMLPGGGGVPRQVVRFDDPLHPIGLYARNFAMHAGRLYFTLQDPQSNIWVAPVTGLSK
ncbi:TolB family protein [Gemmatimonas sp.]|uniref:TolB family protein n=1 Tax=Gemmatimonas sp. TaxID=1962908 RepID=UPI00356575D5